LTRPAKARRIPLVFTIREGEIEGTDTKRSNINAFGIQYERKTGLSTAEFAWAA